MTDTRSRAHAPLLIKGATLVSMDAEIGDIASADSMTRDFKIVNELFDPAIVVKIGLASRPVGLTTRSA